MHLKISSEKWLPFCLGFDVLKPHERQKRAYTMHTILMYAGDIASNQWQKTDIVSRNSREKTQWQREANYVTRLMLSSTMHMALVF